MNIKAVLIDFDGTCLQKDHIYLSLANMHAIRRALDAGIEVIPCSGRTVCIFPPQIEAEKRIRYWVSSSGGRIIDRKEKRVISKCTFTPEESVALIRTFEGQDLYAEIASEGKLYGEKSILDRIWDYPGVDHHVWYMEKGRVHPLRCPSEHFGKKGIGIEKANIYNLNREQETCIRSAIEKLDCAWIPLSGPRSIQFFPRKLNKLEAVTHLLNELGINWEETMAIGDSDLDMSVVKAAGVGVAMGNAIPELKQAANYIAPPNEENGFAEAFGKFLFGENTF